MRIGIIGAGNMGATLAAQLTRLGHQVAIANSRGPRSRSGSRWRSLGTHNTKAGHHHAPTQVAAPACASSWPTRPTPAA